MLRPSQQDARRVSGVAHRLAGRPSVTAEVVCLARAIERLRPERERIVDDPYAELFLGPGGRGALTAWRMNSPATRLLRRLDPGGITFVACRHRYLDDQLMAALDDGVEQVVLLGAGYDGRAYRFADRLGGRPVYEVDLAPISRRKRKTIEANRSVFPDVDVRWVEIDFETDTLADTLGPAGFAPDAATFVVWEGVSMYLTRPAVKATLRALWELCGPGSRAGMDCWYLVDDPGLLGTARRVAPSALSLIGEPVTFGVHHEEMPCFLSPLGFEVVDIATAADLEQRYGGGSRHVEPSMYVLTAERRGAKDR